MNEIIECPICMDEISGEKNKITTECGHCFHASCLMKNVSHNGFGCPYCRTAMAEVPADDNSDNEYDDFSIDGDGNNFSDNVLRGARWLFQRAEGEEVDDDEESVLDDEEESGEEDTRPSVEYIVGKLVQRGVTMEDLVKSLLLMDHDEFQADESFERVDSEVYGSFRAIITSFRRSANANANAASANANANAASANASANADSDSSNACFQTCQYVPNFDGEISDGPQFIHDYETCVTYKSSRLRRNKAEREWLGLDVCDCQQSESDHDDDDDEWVSDNEPINLFEI